MPRGTPKYTLDRALASPAVASQVKRLEPHVVAGLKARHVRTRAFTITQVRGMLHHEIYEAKRAEWVERETRALDDSVPGRLPTRCIPARIGASLRAVARGAVRYASEVTGRATKAAAAAARSAVQKVTVALRSVANALSSPGYLVGMANGFGIALSAFRL